MRTRAATPSNDGHPNAEVVLADGDRSVLVTLAAAAATAFVCAWFPAPDAPPLAVARAQGLRDWTAVNGAALHATAVALLLVALSLILVAAALTTLARRHLGHSVLADLLLACAAVVAVLLTLDMAASTLALLLPGLVGTNLADVPDPVVVGWLSVGGYTHLLGDFQIAFVAAGLLGGTQIAHRLGLINRWLAFGGTAVAGCAALGALGIAAGVQLLYPLWFIGTFGFYLALAGLSVVAVLAVRRLRTA